MTITKRITFTFWCDDGRYCDGGAEKGHRCAKTVITPSKAHAVRLMRDLGWRIRFNGMVVQCPACKHQQHIPDW